MPSATVAEMEPRFLLHVCCVVVLLTILLSFFFCLVVGWSAIWSVILLVSSVRRFVGLLRTTRITKS